MTSGDVQHHFHVESGSHLPEGVGIWLVCDRCGRIVDEPLQLTLANLNRRADEHAAVWHAEVRR